MGKILIDEPENIQKNKKQSLKSVVVDWQRPERRRKKMKCNNYHEERTIRKFIDGVPIYNSPVGRCWGTKEVEPCACGGNRAKCDFYDYIREDAQRATEENKIKQAINLLRKHGYKVSK